MILDRDGNIWLQHSLTRGWELMGGKVDPGEHPDAAIVREIDEECGLENYRLEMLGSFDHGTEIDDMWTCLCYVAYTDDVHKPTIKEPWKVDDIRLFTDHQVRELQKHDQMWSLASDVYRKYHLSARWIQLNERRNQDKPVDSTP